MEIDIRAYDMVYMCMCVYEYIYIVCSLTIYHIIHTRKPLTLISVPTIWHMNLYICMYMCTCLYMYMIYVYAYMCVYIYGKWNMYIYTYIYTYKYIYVYIYIYIHLFVYTCVYVYICIKYGMAANVLPVATYLRVCSKLLKGL